MQESLNDQLIDIYDLIGVPWWHSIHLKMAVALIAVVLCCVGLWRLIRWIKTSRRSKRQEMIEKLKSLHQLSSLTQGQIYQGFIVVRELIKEDLHERYQLDVIQTDDQLKHGIAALPITRSEQQSLHDILDLSAQAIFAHQTISKNLFNDAVKQVLAFVEQPFPKTNKKQ